MKPFKYIHVFITAINVMVAILLLSSAFSNIVSPLKNVTFAYLGLAFPLFLLLNIGFLFFWSVTRKWSYAFLVICSLLICRKPIMQYIPCHFQTGKIPRENVIKILTYNVMCFGYKDHTTAAPNPIIEYIAHSGADIVCMQEYLEGNIDNTLTESKITRALSMYPYHYDLPLVYYKRYTTGLAIYSKYPILNSRKIRYDSSFNGSTIHELDIRGKKVVIVNNHLESFKFTMEDRSKYSDFLRNVNAETFEDIRETLQQKAGQAFRIRAEQADIIADEIKSLQADYMIVCGDFNDTPISYVHRKMQGSLKDAFVESGTGPGVSYNQNLFWFRIDHILHSPNMTSYHATVDRINYSDHYPMWCYLKMN